MPRVAICLPCDGREMLETESIDHLEKLHGKDTKTLTVKEYREWLQKNLIVEDRPVGPHEQPWLKNVHSFGIETRMRHD